MKLVLAALILVSVAQTLASSRAEAQTCTGNCTFPSHGVILVGLDPANGPAPDPAGAFKVTIRDQSNVVVPGVVVYVDFSGCPDVRLCENQREGTAVDCLGKRVSVTTDEFGRAEFDILGYAGGATPVDVHSSCARIVTEPPWLDITVKAAIYDLAGHNGLAVPDLSVLVSDVLNPGGSYFERSDYNFNDVLQANDISHLVGAVLRGRSELGCSSACP